MSAILIMHQAKPTNHVQAGCFLARVNSLLFVYPSCELFVSAMREDVLAVERHNLTSASLDILYHAVQLNKDLNWTIEVIN